MRYSAALQYLNTFLNFERIPFEYRRQFNLKRMNLLLSWFEFPQYLFPSVLIAGTKGKGSTANFLSQIFSTNGYQTGLYTSPHLIDPRERIRVNGKAISKTDFARIVSRIRTVVRRRQSEMRLIEPITYFEIFTLLTILYFADRNVEIGIFEVGMGGRLDATNVLRPLVSVIASISYDHQEHLGNTLKAIAGEKAAIIKQGGLVVSADQPKEAAQIIRAEVRKQRAKGYFFGEQFRALNERISEDGGTFDFEIGGHPRMSLSGIQTLDSRLKRAGMTRLPGLRMTRVQIPLPGRFQIKNAALALETAGLLENHYDFNFKEKKVRSGLRKAFWPGRFERVKRLGKTWVLDGAHNGASMEELSSTLKQLYPHKEITVIFGTSREKKLSDQLKPLLPISKSMVLTKSANPRAQEPKVILEAVYGLKYARPTFLTHCLTEAIEAAHKMSSKNSILVVTGSLFLIGEAREILKCPKFI